MDIVIFAVLFVGGGFLLASFTGGVASAIAAGGREDNSIFTNAAVGFLGWLAAGVIWTQAHGTWPDEMTPGLLLLTFGCSLVIAMFPEWRGRRHVAG